MNDRVGISKDNGDIRRYKVMIRKRKGDDWQELTGAKYCTLERMKEKCIGSDLNYLDYHLGIFVMGKSWSDRYKRYMTKWVLKAWYNLRNNRQLQKITGQDMKLPMTKTDLANKYMSNERKKKRGLAQVVCREQREGVFVVGRTPEGTKDFIKERQKKRKEQREKKCQKLLKAGLMSLVQMGT